MSIKKPNILLIMADQLRTKSLTGMGDGIETPNIDRIRDISCFFPLAACPAPLCTPSRASLATGKMPHRCGVMEHDANLPHDEETYYQILRKNGYRVAIAGKTDLHKRDGTLGTHGPLPIAYHIGFTDPAGETEGKMISGLFHRDGNGNRIPRGPYQRYLLEQHADGIEEMEKEYTAFIRRRRPVYETMESTVKEEHFLDHYIGRLACEFLRNETGDAPWHLILSFAGPHNPWDPPKEEIERLHGKQYPQTPTDTLDGKPAWIKNRSSSQSAGLTPAALNNTKLHYDGAVQVIDTEIGKVLDILERKGELNDTVILFTADHGELLGDHGLFEKTTMYEGSLRIPLLIHLPNMQHRSECHELASLMDLAPTILELAGAEYCRDAMDGISLLGCLNGTAPHLRDVQQSELRNTMMLFDGTYKWIRNFNDLDEVYNLVEDPDELHNLYPQASSIIQKFLPYTFLH